MKRKLIALTLLLTLTLTGCNKGGTPDVGGKPDHNNSQGNSNITTDDTSYGEDLGDLGANDGYFEEEVCDVSVKCVSGSAGCYKLENGVLTFTKMAKESVYTVSGKLAGNIVIDIGDTGRLELELCDFSLVSSENSPITILSGDKVTVQAKKDTTNYIYDTRAAVDEDNTNATAGAIFSDVDLEISGKGKLFVISENNNGIHSKKDLKVQNLTLTVSSADNALKGNDSVTLEDAIATVIATKGDCIKTTNSDISDKGNQRGTVFISGGQYELYAACDGIDAAYDVVVDNENTSLSIYTDKYSNYSDEITAVSKSTYYIRFNSSQYKYSVKYYNSEDDFVWENAEYHSTVSGGRTKYYYYSFPKKDGYSKLQFYVYSSNMEQGQDTNYSLVSDLVTPSDAYDTIALTSRNGYVTYDWTNYSTSVNQGPGGGFPGGGGFQDGNNDKGDHSTKGIKSANEIRINNGYISIKSYDDALHSSSDEALENGKSPTGNITVNGGSTLIYSNDDGLHADGNLTVNGGKISIINSYEGAEGTTVSILGGELSIISKDDGINATATSGTSITIAGGTLYIFCSGDCIDSNSRTSYGGIAFKGGKSLLITTSGGNSAIDSEQGYSYSGGSVVAVMPQGGMSSESTHCQNFSSIGKSTKLSLTKGQYLLCNIGSDSLTANMPSTISALIIMLGDSSATVKSQSTSSHNLSEGEFIWE